MSASPPDRFGSRVAAPWQELFDVSAALVGCGHVSGLLMRRVAAGPNALRGSGPNPSRAFDNAMTLAGSPDPRNDRICITSSCPRQFVEAFCFLSAKSLPAVISVP